MLEIFVLSSMASGIFWYMTEVDLWYLSIFIALLSLTKYDYDTYMSSIDIKKGLATMEKTQCCDMNCLQDPKIIKTTTLALRAITGLLACGALVSSYYYSDKLTDQNIDIISTFWTIVCLFWFISMVPTLISLLQCAAAKTTPDIVRYRTLMSIYLLHDIFLGAFWAYLSLELYDLVNDQNDKEWRKIFLSMLWWHLIILSGLALYAYPKQAVKSVTCCGRNTLSRWKQFFLLFSIFSIYIVIINRMREDTLLNMKMPLSSLFIFELSLAVGYFCKKTIFIRGKSVSINDLQMKAGEQNYNRIDLMF